MAEHIINLNNYSYVVDNSYIVYSAQKLLDHGNISDAISFFARSMQTAASNQIGDMNEIGQQQIVDMLSKGPGIAAGLNAAASVQSYVTLEATMDQIAAGINEGIQHYYQSGSTSVEGLIKDASSFKTSFIQGDLTVATINRFFDELYKGLRAAGSYDMGLVVQLTKIGQYLTGDTKATFNLSPQWTENAVTALTERDIEMCRQVTDILWNAATKYWQAGGTLDSRSFSSMIGKLFRDTIGPQIGQVMVANGVLEGLTDFESKLSRIPNLTVTNPTPKVKGSIGSSQILDNEGIELRIDQNGQSVLVELISRGDVRFENSLRQSALALTRSVQLGEIFPAGSEQRFWAYNIIAHKSDFEGAYQQLRGSLAATFFTDWAKTPEIAQKAQFLLIDGQVYSLQRIIRNICNELMKQGGDWGGSMPFQIHGGVPQNTWRGSGKPSTWSAIQRSNSMNAVLNTLTIAATLNYNVLKRFAY